MQQFDYVYWDSGYTSKCDELIKESFKNAELMLIDEKLSHDGFDIEGPKSDLWDLWILEKTSDDYLLHNFHWENWFCKGDKDLKYEFEFNEVMKNSISLVYGVYGDRIFAVGGSGVDHIYEKSFHKLDLVWSSKLSKKIDAKLAFDNILNPEYKLEVGKNSRIPVIEASNLMESFKRGTGVSLNLSYTF